MPNPDEVPLELDDDDTIPSIAQGVEAKNPEEVLLDVDEFNATPTHQAFASTSVETIDAAAQPDSALDESVDLKEAKRAALAFLLGSNPVSLSTPQRNSSAIDLDEDQIDKQRSAESTSAEDESTRFLALGKCAGRNDFLQVSYIHLI